MLTPYVMNTHETLLKNLEAFCFRHVDIVVKDY